MGSRGEVRERWKEVKTHLGNKQCQLVLLLRRQVTKLHANELRPDRPSQVVDLLRRRKERLLLGIRESRAVRLRSALDVCWVGRDVRLDDRVKERRDCRSCGVVDFAGHGGFDGYGGESRRKGGLAEQQGSAGDRATSSAASRSLPPPYRAFPLPCFVPSSSNPTPGRCAAESSLRFVSFLVSGHLITASAGRKESGRGTEDERESEREGRAKGRTRKGGESPRRAAWGDRAASQ
jgi:hypothetical protein